MAQSKKNRSAMARRKFLQLSAATLGSAGAVRLPSAQAAESRAAAEESRSKGPSRGSKHLYNGEYTGAWLNRVAFPMGGIGAGMICLEGSGALSHVSLRNKPEVFNEPLIFAALTVKSPREVARVLEGPVPGWKLF